MAGRLGCPATSLARPLARLQELGIIVREIPFGESEKSCKRALYKIGDPFFAFWFRVVAPRRGFLAGATRKARMGVWYSFKQELFARVWEDLCRRAVAALAAENGWGCDWHPAARWWRGDAPEWDVVSVSADGKRGLVGEVKWSDRPFTSREVCHIGESVLTRAPPPGLPNTMRRMIFVPSVAEPSDLANAAWRLEDAASVLSCLR